MMMLALAKRLGDVSRVAMEAGDWGIKPQPCDANTLVELGVRYSTVADVQAESDFLGVLLPHSVETAEMINAAFLAGDSLLHRLV